MGDGLSEDSDEETSAVLIRKLIKFIQKEAKQYRHGLEFAKLKLLTNGGFKRPKVWSRTRMVVYEFDMTNRFLENSVYLDIPLKYLPLAQCHCLVIYTLKLILKTVHEN